MVDGATTQHVLNGAEAMGPSGPGSSDDAMAACTVLDSPTQQQLYRMLRDPLTSLQVRGAGAGALHVTVWAPNGKGKTRSPPPRLTARWVFTTPTAPRSVPGWRRKQTTTI